MIKELIDIFIRAVETILVMGFVFGLLLSLLLLANILVHLFKVIT